MPDEFLYAELGRSAYASHSLDVLGRDVPFYSFVHPLLIGGPLSIGDPERGYSLAKSLQVVVMMSAAVPAYAWARRLVPPVWALLAGALTLVPPALAYAGLLVTEASFYPAFVLAAWATARAITRPTPTGQALAVAAILLAAAVRVQALVLLPAFVTAVVLAALLERRPRVALRLAPACAALLVAFGAWFAFQVARAGTASSVLGGYASTADLAYSPVEVARYVLYHMGDVLLFTAVLPVCALASLAYVAIRRPERDPDLHAYLAVALSFLTWMILEVGSFASRYVHHLAERNLFHVAPLLFVGLVVWLQRGAPRAARGSFVIALVAFVLVVALPAEEFPSLRALHNEFMLVPLYELTATFPNVDLEVLVRCAALALVLLFAVAPRRALLVLGVLLVPLGVLGSVVTSTFVVDQAAAAEQRTFGGPATRWIDRIASGPVAYLYDGPRFYPGVLQTTFWNRRIVGSMSFHGQPSRRCRGAPCAASRSEPSSGHLDGLGEVRYVVAPDTLTFVGTELDRRAGLVLTRLVGRPRLVRRLYGFRTDGTINGAAGLQVYGCKGGTLELDVRAGRAAAIDVTRNGGRHLRLRVRRGQPRHLEVELAVPRGEGPQRCGVALHTRGKVRTERIRFRAPHRR